MVFSKEINIKALFERLAKNDEEAFRQLYEASYQTLFAIAYFYGRDKEFANDVVQDIFLKIWERRREMPAIENPEGWLTNSAKFQMLKALKKEISKETYLSRLEEDRSENAEQKMMAAHRTHLINQAIAALPARQQQVYRLAREEGLTYKEIAAQLQLGRETVKEHAARAFKAIYEFLRLHKDLLLLLAVGKLFF